MVYRRRGRSGRQLPSITLGLWMSLVLAPALFGESTAAKPELVVVQGRYHGYERELGFTPDGELLVTVGGSVAKIWHVTSGNILRDFDSPDRWIPTARLDLAGDRLAIGGDRGAIELREVTTGAFLLRIETPSRVVTLDWSTEGRTLASYSWDGDAIELWNVDSGELRGRLSASGKPYTTLRFQPTGELLAASHGQGIDLWDLATGHRRATLEAPVAAGNLHLAWSRDGRRLASGDQKGRVHVWDAESFSEVTAFERPGRIGGLAFRDQGRQLVVAAGLVLSLVDSASGQEQIRHEIPGSRVVSISSLAMTVDERHLALYGGSARLHLFDLEQGEASPRMDKIARGLEAVAWSRDGRYLASAGEDRIIRVRELATGEIRHTFDGHRRAVRDLAFTPDGRFLLSGSDDGTVAFWALDRSDLRRALVSPLRVNTLSSEIYSIAVTPDGRRVAGSLADHQNPFVHVWEIPTGKLVERVEPGGGARRGLMSIAYTPDGATLISADSYGGIRARGPDGEIQTLREPDSQSMGNITTLAPSPDGRWLAYPNLDLETRHAPYTVEVRNTADGELWRTLRGHADEVDPVAWSPDGRILASGSDDFTVKLWSVDEGRVLSTLRAHRAPVTDLAWSPDGRWLASTGRDGTARLWDLARETLLLSILELDDADGSVIFTPDHYYMSTTQALDTVRVSLGRESYPFDQFDLLLHRPDLVLERFPQPDAGLIEAYRQAHLKRLDFLGFDRSPDVVDSLSLPHLEILNEDQLASRTDRCSLEIQVRARASGSPLARIDVWVNDVPIFGSRGVDAGEGTDTFQRSLRLELGAGENHLQVSASDQTGVESRRWNRRVVCELPRAPSSRWHVIAVGVSRYRDENMNLRYAAKDARDLSRLFSEAMGQHTERADVHLLTDAEATREALLALGENLRQTSIDDKVLIFFAGHGMWSDLDYYLATADTDFSRLTETALPFRELERLVDGIPARTRVIMIDACESGEIDPDAPLPDLASRASGLRVEPGPRPRGGRLLRQRGDAFQLMRQLFGDLRRTTGATVIASAGGYQAALEDETWSNGAFTYSLLSGLKEARADFDGNRRILLSELLRHVAVDVPRLTAGLQRPTLRLTNLRLDFQLWPLEASTPRFERYGLSLVRGNVVETRPNLDAEPELIFTGAGAPIVGFQYGPDGSWFVTLDEAGYVHLRDAVTGESLRFFRAASTGVEFSLSADGQRIATGDQKRARVWDLTSGRMVGSFEGDPDVVMLRPGAVALSPSGKTVVMEYDYRNLAVWDVESGEQQGVIPTGNRRVRSMCFTGNGRYLVARTRTTMGEAGLVLWDFETLKSLRGGGLKVSAFSCGRGDAGIVQGLPDGRVFRIDANARSTQVRAFDPKRFEAIDLSDDGRLIAARAEGGVSVWDGVTREAVTELAGVDDTYGVIRFRPTDPAPRPPEVLRRPPESSRHCEQLGANFLHRPKDLAQWIPDEAIDAALVRDFIDRSLGIPAIDIGIYGKFLARQRLLPPRELERSIPRSRYYVGGADCVLGGSIVNLAGEGEPRRLALEVTVTDFDDIRYSFRRIYGADRGAGVESLDAAGVRELLEEAASDLRLLLAPAG